MFSTPAFSLEKDTRFEIGLFLFLLFVYAGSFFFPLMDKDAARHANVALHMYQTGDYLRLVERGNPYLDKPHFLFWCEAFSYNLFGVNTFAARLPHFLFALLSVFSVYKLARHLSDNTTAKLAALILATAQAFMLAIMDARMETPLTAGIALGLWQLVVYIDRQLFKNLIWAALGAALAFSTKGWVGPILIFTTAFFYVLLQNKWRVFALGKTYLFIPLFALFIAPVVYAYYVQFDLHPELVVRGRTGHSGVAFILWNQNTERFEGDTFSEGGRNSSYFFLYHTFLWAFFPWSILAYAGLFYSLKRLFKKKEGQNPFNAFALSFACLLFLISFSKFKMPHYIIMLFPLAALFTASYLRAVLSSDAMARPFILLHRLFVWLIVPVVLLLNFYFFKPFNVLMWVVDLLVLLGYIILLLKRWPTKMLGLVYTTAALALVFNFFLNYTFFPSLLRYQGGNALVKTVQQLPKQIPDADIMLLQSNAHSFDFYRAYNHPVVELDSLLQQPALTKNHYFLLDQDQERILTAQGFQVQPVASAVDYNVSILTLKFLNRATRAQKLDTLLLATLHKP